MTEPRFDADELERLFEQRFEPLFEPTEQEIERTKNHIRDLIKEDYPDLEIDREFLDTFARRLVERRLEEQRDRFREATLEGQDD